MVAGYSAPTSCSCFTRTRQRIPIGGEVQNAPGHSARVLPREEISMHRSGKTLLGGPDTLFRRRLLTSNSLDATNRKRKRDTKASINMKQDTLVLHARTQRGLVEKSKQPLTNVPRNCPPSSQIPAKPQATNNPGFDTHIKTMQRRVFNTLLNDKQRSPPRQFSFAHARLSLARRCLHHPFPNTLQLLPQGLKLSPPPVFSTASLRTRTKSCPNRRLYR